MQLLVNTVNTQRQASAEKRLTFNEACYWFRFFF